MNVLILDASPGAGCPLSTAGDAAVGALEAAGDHVSRMILRDMNIGTCCGSFNCWVKTPGHCTTRDDGRLIGNAMIDADMLVLLTPVSFGGYGSLAKSAMDRCLPALLPFLGRFQGEVHHPVRAGRNKRLAVVGALDAPDAASETLLRRVVARNSLNMRSPAHGVAFVYAGDGKEAAAAAVCAAIAAADHEKLGDRP